MSKEVQLSMVISLGAIRRLHSTMLAVLDSGYNIKKKFLRQMVCFLRAGHIYIYIQVKKKAFKINAKIEDVGLNED